MTTFRVAAILVMGSVLSWWFGESVGFVAAGIPAFLLLLILTPFGLWDFEFSLF